MKPPAPLARPLLHAIGLRLAIVALGLIGIMTIFTLVEYTCDVEKLRRATLEQQTDEMFDALRSGRAAKFFEYCRTHPRAYGYRVFDDRNEIMEQANGELFPEMPRYRSGRPDLSFKHYPGGDPWGEQWFITRGADINGRPLWIHATLIGDPAALWRGVVAKEIVKRVIIPALVIVPALSVAIYLALRSALRPLSRIAARARDLAREADSGAPLQGLRMEDLPQEALDLVSAINVLLQKLDSMLAEQKQFTDNAAHELRTPLAALLLQISCLPPSEPVERLKSDVAVMRRLIDQMLRLAQAEQLAKAGFQANDLREVVRAVCEDMALQATRQGRLLEFDEPPAPVLVSCNAEFIQIAVRNIVENALHAAPIGSSVSIAVYEPASVSVSDRGPGIAEAEKPLVFQRCWTQRRRSGEGAGIGLALVQRIADLHAGATRIEDRAGGGARVTLSLRPARTRNFESRACAGRARVIDVSGLSAFASPAPKDG
jgi:signal transduction histidine kinase